MAPPFLFLPLLLILQPECLLRYICFLLFQRLLSSLYTNWIQLEPYAFIPLHSIPSRTKRRAQK